jgi:hypothetical protein
VFDERATIGPVDGDPTIGPVDGDLVIPREGDE